MTRRIKKVAIIGSGIMGSGIACHFANIGVEVLLLDIVPRELNDKEKAKGLTLEDKIVRNRLVNDALMTSLKSKPSPIYSQKFADRITTGNIEDDLHLIKEVDWVMEVVVERLDIKQQVFEKIEKFRTPGTIISSNTSGIPIHFMNEGRSDDFQQHFAVTHFFNPPRYLKLFEVVPGPNCKPEITDFLMNYGSKFLGKTSVLAKDTPAFIGNRIGIFGIQSLFHQVKELGLTVEEVDKLTGPVIGRPKSATFRTVDVVGLDTLVHVANGIYENCPEDEAHELFKLPSFIKTMMENKWLGSKTGQGFYKKSVDANGQKEILTLDLETLEYRSNKRAKFATLELTKTIDKPIDRFKVLVIGKDKAGEFYRKNFSAMFEYVSNRIPEISDEVYRIDDAMKAGFGWENGPFEIWDAIGVEKGIEIMKAEGKTPASWVTDMLANGSTSFYSVKEGATYYYDIPAKTQTKKPGQDAFIILDNIRKSNEVFKNSGVVIEDLGDGILNCEFQSKMNTIGGDVLAGINKAIDLAAAKKRRVVVCGTEIDFAGTTELTWGLILGLARNFKEEIDNMYQGYWQSTIGFELKGKILGLVGLGRVGSQVAKIGKAFGMEVMAWSENLNLDTCKELGVLPCSKEDLFQNSDFLSIHVQGGERYKELIKLKELDSMKKTAFLINTSRGSIINEDDLIIALSTNVIAGAGLDVYETEPLPEGNKLRFLPNALLMPHVGYVTAENYSVFYTQMIEGLEACVAGKPLRVLE